MSDLSTAAADALDMVQPVLRRCVQRRRESLDTTSPPTSRDIVAGFGISKSRLYGIAARLDASGSKDEAHHIIGGATGMPEIYVFACDHPDAGKAAINVMFDGSMDLLRLTLRGASGGSL